MLAVAATALALTGLVMPAASAAPPPPAGSLDVAVSSNVSVPATAGAPALLIERSVPFDVTVTVLDVDGNPLVLSSSKSTTVHLTVGGEAVGTVVVPGGASSATGSATVATSANDLRVHAVAKVPAGTKVNEPPLDGDSNAFDVMGDVASIPQSMLNDPNVLVSAAGVNAPCEATVQKPTCVDLLLPFGATSAAFFATGECDAAVACTSPDRELQLLLANFGAGTSNTNPATAIVKCDKSLCPGGGIQTYTLQVSLSGDGALPSSAAPACASKGVVDTGDFCVDYVQSKRDGSGDTHLYLLLARDARMSCC